MKLDRDDPRLTAFALGEIEDPGERAAIQAAVDADPALAREVEGIRATAGRLETAFQAEPVASLSEEEKDALGGGDEDEDDAPGILTQRQHERMGALREARDTQRHRSRKRRQPRAATFAIAAGLAAAVVLLAGMFIADMLHDLEGPRVAEDASVPERPVPASAGSEGEEFPGITVRSEVADTPPAAERLRHTAPTAARLPAGEAIGAEVGMLPPFYVFEVGNPMAGDVVVLDEAIFQPDWGQFDVFEEATRGFEPAPPSENARTFALVPPESGEADSFAAPAQPYAWLTEPKADARGADAMGPGEPEVLVAGSPGGPATRDESFESLRDRTLAPDNSAASALGLASRPEGAPTTGTVVAVTPSRAPADAAASSASEAAGRDKPVRSAPPNRGGRDAFAAPATPPALETEGIAEGAIERQLEAAGTGESVVEHRTGERAATADTADTTQDEAVSAALAARESEVAEDAPPGRIVLEVISESVSDYRRGETVAEAVPGAQVALDEQVLAGKSTAEWVALPFEVLYRVPLDASVRLYADGSADTLRAAHPEARIEVDAEGRAFFAGANRGLSTAYDGGDEEAVILAVEQPGEGQQLVEGVFVPRGSVRYIAVKAATFDRLAGRETSDGKPASSPEAAPAVETAPAEAKRAGEVSAAATAGAKASEEAAEPPAENGPSETTKSE